MLEAELLPELHPDLVPALPHLKRDDLPRHFSVCFSGKKKETRVQIASVAGDTLFSKKDQIITRKERKKRMREREREKVGKVKGENP